MKDRLYWVGLLLLWFTGAVAGYLIAHHPDCNKSQFVACVEHPSEKTYNTRIHYHNDLGPGYQESWLWEVDKTRQDCAFIWYAPDPDGKPSPYYVMVAAEPYKNQLEFKAIDEAQAYVEHWCKP